MTRSRIRVLLAAIVLALASLTLSQSYLAAHSGPRRAARSVEPDTVRKRRTSRRIPVRKEVPPVDAPPSWTEFPDPPPAASARYSLPDNLLSAGAVDTLGKVAERVRSALIRGDIQEWAVYPLHKDGFAYVTRLEYIDPDGRPKPGRERFPNTYGTAPGEQSFIEFLRGLLVAEPGYYRVIAIVVTSRPVADTGSAATYEQMERAVKGPQLLPAAMIHTKVKNLHATALIYQFKSPNRDSAPVLLRHSTAPPVQHLASAGLWSARELVQR